MATVNVIVLVLTSLVLILGGAALAARLSGPSVIERLLALITTTLSVLVACLLVAGTAWFLRPVAVAVEYVVVCGLLVIVCGARRTWQWLARLAVDVRPVAMSALRALNRPWMVILAVVAAAEVAWRVALDVLLPPTSYDALNHHLVQTALWLQHGGFVSNPFNATANPATTELVFAHIGLFTHQAQIIDATQIPFALFGSLATIGLARLVGASRPTAVVAGVLFFLTPIVLSQSAVAYDDIATAAEFVIAMYFVTLFLKLLPSAPEASRLRSTKLLVLAGLAGGLCMGSRPQTPRWMLVIAVVLVVNLILATRKRWITPVAAVGNAATFVLATLFLGLYWYIEDHVVHFHAVYPVAVPKVPAQASTVSRFPISVVKSWAHDLVPFLHSSELFYRYDQRSGGLGPVWDYLMIPLLVLTAVGLCRHRDRILISVLAIAILSWVIAPYQWWSRVTVQLVVAGAVVTAIWLTRLSARSIGTAIAWIMTGLVMVGVVMSTWQYQLGDGRAVDIRQVVELAGASPDARTFNLGGYNVANRAPTGDLIAVDPNNVQFPFVAWGMHFQHRVVAVDLAGPKAWPRLESSKAQYVFVATGSTVGVIAPLPPDETQLVAAGGGFRLYRITAA